MSGSAGFWGVARAVAWRSTHNYLTNPSLLLPTLFFPLFFFAAFAGVAFVVFWLYTRRYKEVDHYRSTGGGTGDKQAPLPVATAVEKSETD